MYLLNTDCASGCNLLIYFFYMENPIRIQPSLTQSSKQTLTEFLPTMRTLISPFFRNKEIQSAAVDNGLSSTAQEVRAVVSVASALMWDTPGSCSALYLGEKWLAKGIEDGVQSRVVQPATGWGCTEGEKQPVNERRETVIITVTY